MSPAQTRRSRWWLAAGLAAAGLLVLAGCGTAASASSTGTANGGTAAWADTQLDAFASCMAENGVTLPERSGSPQGGPPPDGGTPPQGAAAGGGTPPAPEGVDAEAWTVALQACGDVLPTPPEQQG